jgi:hypothetical protein
MKSEPAKVLSVPMVRGRMGPAHLILKGQVVLRHALLLLQLLKSV